ANTPPQGIGAPPCEFAGQELDVIGWNHGVEGGLVPVKNAAETFRSWFEWSLPGESDEHGSGEPRVIGFEDRGDEGTLALMALLDPQGNGENQPWRAIITLGFEYRDAGWKVVSAGTPLFPGVDAWLALDAAEFPGWERWK